MVDDLTGTMAGEPRRAPSSDARPGLVLVYASDLDAVPPVILLEEGNVVVGREPPPGGVKIALGSVSRVHARLSRKGIDVTVHDLGSRNGVLVRGQAVTASTPLRPGDDVRIGDALFVFVPDDAQLFVGTRVDGKGERPYPYAAIACGPVTRRVFDALVPIAAANIPVVVLGDTGTGKELVAEAIHAASGRGGTIRALNCAAIPPNLVESELFGFKKGAFTGADRDSTGIVRSAHGGTLFLDEIGDLPSEVQPKLLRLLEANEIAPVGAARTEKVDVRVVCATHADLEELVRTKKFRADLYSRLRGHVVRLPPLRDRKEDLYRLVRVLLARLGRPDAEVSMAFMTALVRHDWPFNVRELFSVLRRAVALAPEGQVLDVQHLPEDMLAPTSDDAVSSAQESSRRTDAEDDEPKPPIPTADELRAALAANDGNVAALARIYKRDRSLIHRWLKQHGIEPGDFRS